ncbi:DsbA family protein [Cryobacterium sp. 1639]|uniref:DsbA family protein n=1 Tax=Cryobacterium inferilacus TaxID=2866629 RepID=UPI001C73A6DF|nr:thioredoxin domain-containing protein [Cryobacterium sp. 1639]MBX0300274.1 DsbA family protein [Cryobacterium sp. 1639]
MTTGGPGDSRPAKTTRDAARTKAAKLRVQQKKRDRRNRFLLQGGIGVVAVAVITAIVLIIVNSVQPAGPGPKNMASDGILLGPGLAAVTTPALQPDDDLVPSLPDASGAVADIRVYLDYLCPFCGTFEKNNSDQISQWVEAGAATLEIHPISILTSKSAGTQYSLRAANAAACVANWSPDDFFAVNAALFADQPVEGTVGLSDEELKALVRDAGVSTGLSSIEECIDETTYRSWVKAATDRALSGPIPNSTLEAITGTPTVLVNGKQYVGALDDPKEFAAFVLQAASETYSTADPAPAG